MLRLKEESSSVECDLAAEVIRAFGVVRLRAMGTSMVPALQPGDTLSVERAALQEISPGEIVLYARQGRLFAHRVVTGRGDAPEPRLITRGDRLGHNDSPVSSSELLGRVAYIERAHRRVMIRTRLSGPQLLLRWILRSSDRATFLFVRLTSLWRALAGKKASKRVACQV